MTTTEIPTTTESFTDDANCDFEKDLCDYTPNSRFVRYKGKAPANIGTSSGPPNDHTTGTGYYALCVGSKLILDSDECTLNKTFTNNNHVKFSFWYYLYGVSVGTLKLLKNNELIWSDSIKEKTWKKSEIDFPIGTFTV